jgi:hypothetical protein
MKVIANNLDEVEKICTFTLPRLNTDQDYNTLVQQIRTFYDNSLTENEEIVTKFMYNTNQLITFNRYIEMEAGVQCQMDAHRRDNPDSTMCVFDVYTGTTADHKRVVQSNFVFV